MAFNHQSARALSPLLGAPPGTVPNYINPVTRGNEIVVTSIVLTSLAFVFVVTRVLLRLFVKKSFGWDDVFCVCALMFAIARTVIGCIMVDVYGIGRHIWDFIPRISWLRTMMFYVVQKFRYFCYAMMSSTIIYCLTFFFLIAFDCKDEHYTWHFSVTASCIEITTLNIANGALNLATDVVIMIMPLPLIWNLQLQKAQKWGLLAVFSTGIFVCASTLVREIIIVKTDKEVDQSWATVGEITWMKVALLLLPNQCQLTNYCRTVELNVAIICISLPMLSPVYTRIIATKLNMTSLRNLFSLSGRSLSALDSNKSKYPDNSNKDTNPYNDSINLVEMPSKQHNSKHSIRSIEESSQSGPHGHSMLREDV
ncbi:hypothetical protein DID88_001529 [Monilinia fructigena]|uniref:Rhodopsin domain-containing protein n=1 Tax=Monilinia fructigena TaxID=38457 RepID=A0A395IYQ2_9HELO|nr:hypothetical protein DID88_001529 [Monilinia fructigena]